MALSCYRRRICELPSPSYGTLSIGKAGIKNLALQFNERLKPDGIYVGTLTINGMVSPESDKTSPVKLAQHYWDICANRIEAEVRFNRSQLYLFRADQPDAFIPWKLQKVDIPAPLPSSSGLANSKFRDTLNISTN
jgi:hypothetical protein